MQQDQIEQSHAEVSKSLDRPYQPIASQSIIQRPRTALFAPMGAGKTKIILDALAILRVSFEQQTPILIVCSGSSIAVWEEQIPLWYDPECVIAVARGKPLERKCIYDNYKEYDFIITTYDTMLRDLEYLEAIRVDIIIADESHRMRNRKTKAYKAFKTLSWNTPRVILASGTQVRSSPQDLWTAFNLVNRRVFPSYWKFVNTWCYVEDGQFGREVFGVRNAAKLREVVNRYMVVVRDIDKYLPEVTRIAVPVEMTGDQKRWYTELRDDMMTEMGSKLVIARNTLASVTKFRQLLVCPRLLSPEIQDYGAILPVVAERLEEEPHAVIFTPFRAVIPHIWEYLEKYSYEHKFVLSGQTPKEDIPDIIKKFKDTRGLMICTIAFAQSFSLESCNVGHMVGYDWDPDTNAQAEDRLRRTNSKHDAVRIFYYKHANTIETSILSLLNQKQRVVDTIMQEDGKK